MTSGKCQTRHSTNWFRRNKLSVGPLRQSYMLNSVVLVMFVEATFHPNIPLWLMVLCSGCLLIRSTMLSIRLTEDNVLVVDNPFRRRRVNVTDIRKLQWKPYGFLRLWCLLEIVLDSGSVVAAGVSATRSMGFEGLVGPLARRRQAKITRFFNVVGVSTEGLEPSCCP